MQENNEGPSVPQFILGETFGFNVQDLTYGRENGQVDFRVFACAQGYRGKQHYENWETVEGELKERFGFETVPVLYRGPFSKEVMLEHTVGATTVDATDSSAKHIREGIVITPASERMYADIGRVCFKSVSEFYLTRKNGSEYS